MRLKQLKHVARCISVGVGVVVRAGVAENTRSSEPRVGHVAAVRDVGIFVGRGGHIARLTVAGRSDDDHAAVAAVQDMAGQ
jgi:hypothetical protein